MRWALICAVLAGCNSNGTGTVVYSESQTGHIMTADVATGAITTLDLGVFANVSIAPDRQHVAYVGADNIPKVTDMLGGVIELPQTGGCGSPLLWGPGNTLTYCIVDNLSGFSRTGLLPGLGGTFRTLTTNSLAISSDGSRVAYLDLANPTMSSLGDLVVEDANGANRKVLIPSLEVDRVVFLPDDSGIVISELIQENNFIEHTATVTLDGKVADLGEGLLADPLPHGARFSPDGREVLAVTGGHLVALDLASGTPRAFAMAGGNVTIVGAAFLDANRIVYSRQDTSFMGDVGSSTSTVRFAADGTDKVTLASSDGSSICQVTDVAAAAGQVELVCAVPAIVDLEGSLITSRNAMFALGISGDHAGMVTVDMFGTIEYVSDSGSVRPLATANTSSNSSTLSGPFAAYAP